MVVEAEFTPFQVYVTELSQTEELSDMTSILAIVVVTGVSVSVTLARLTLVPTTSIVVKAEFTPGQVTARELSQAVELSNVTSILGIVVVTGVSVSVTLARLTLIPATGLCNLVAVVVVAVVAVGLVHMICAHVGSYIPYFQPQTLSSLYGGSQT